MVNVSRRARLFDDFFQIDEAEVAFERFNGSMTLPLRRLVFERGDSVAALRSTDNAARSGMVLAGSCPGCCAGFASSTISLSLNVTTSRGASLPGSGSSGAGSALSMGEGAALGIGKGPSLDIGGGPALGIGGFAGGMFSTGAAIFDCLRSVIGSGPKSTSTSRPMSAFAPPWAGW